MVPLTALSDTFVLAIQIIGLVLVTIGFIFLLKKEKE